METVDELFKRWLWFEENNWHSAAYGMLNAITILTGEPMVSWREEFEARRKAITEENSNKKE